MSEYDFEWQCEHCNSMETGEPETIDKVPGYEGTVELWFCEDCTNE